MMKYRIEVLEDERTYGKSWKEINIHPTLGYAYRYSQDAENELANFSEVIWENDIPAILEDCRRFGIREFTISSTFSSLIETIAAFEESGCTLDGIVKINSRYDIDWTTVDGVQVQIRKKIPAFKMTVNA